MVKCRSKFRKCGEYVEVRVGPDTSYVDFASEAAKAVNLEEDDDDTFCDLGLFRSDGTRIPDASINEELPWTVYN